MFVYKLIKQAWNSDTEHYDIVDTSEYLTESELQKRIGKISEIDLYNYGVDVYLAPSDKNRDYMLLDFVPAEIYVLDD